jgi:hypothetical protein
VDDCELGRACNWPWPNLRYWPDICLEGLKISMKDLRIGLSLPRFESASSRMFTVQNWPFSVYGFRRPTVVACVV